MSRLWVLLLTFAFWSPLGCKAEDSADTAGDSPEDSGEIIVTSGVQPTSGISGGGAAGVSELERAKDGLTFAEIAGGNPDPDHVKLHLTLAVEMSNGVKVAWASSLPSSVSSTGEVSRGPFVDGDVPVTLTATLSDATGSTTKLFALVVIAQDPTDQEAVTAALGAMTESLLKKTNVSLNSVTTDLTLPTAWDFQVGLAWASTNSAVAVSGVVTRPGGSSPNAEGDLTVTATRNAASGQKTLHFRVLKQLPVLMVTEVSPTTFDNTGWIEVKNTTGAALQLADFGMRACDDSYDCIPTSVTLPSVVIGADKYFLIHPDHVFGAIKVNGATDAFVPGLYFNEQKAFIELTQGGQTIDFVRWQDASHTVTTNPLSSSFTGAVTMPNGLASTSIGRKFPYNDSNATGDWISFSRSSPGGDNGTGAAAGTDTDGDGLTDDYETNTSLTNPAVADTDGDWFLDGQEVLDSGLAGINLKELGADPLVRDIFVELDWMANPAGQANSQTDSTSSPYMLPLRKAALDLVRSTFQNYVPDGNDANQYPLQIHFDAGDLFDQAAGLDPGNYDLGGGNAIPFNRCAYLGTDATHTSANCANVYKIKQDNFNVARRNVFHYFVVSWSQDPGGTPGSSGLAEFFGNDGLISVGSWPYGSGLEQYIVNVQAATLLHELGHNLGLAHGGDENTNYKPNYVSSMNYEYQLYGLDHDDDGDVFRCAMSYSGCAYDNNYLSTAFKLGYSRGTRTTLNEASLAEPAGWATVAVDFNGDGDQTDAALSWNIQPSSYNSSSTDQLHDYDDWNALFLAYQSEEQNYWNGVSMQRTRATRTSTSTSTESSDEQALAPPCAFNPAL